MISGFGVGVTMSIEDISSGSNIIGRVTARRGSADNIGYLELGVGAGGNTTGVHISEVGSVGILNISPTAALDVNGTARVRTVGNAVGNFATYSANGTFQQRTPLESSNDILKSISGYNAGVAQRLEHDSSGNINWINI